MCSTFTDQLIATSTIHPDTPTCWVSSGPHGTLEGGRSSGQRFTCRTGESPKWCVPTYQKHPIQIVYLNCIYNIYICIYIYIIFIYKRFKRWRNFGISGTTGTNSWFFILVHFMKSHAVCNVMVAKFHIPNCGPKNRPAFLLLKITSGHSPGDRKSYPVNRKDRKAFTLSLGIPGYSRQLLASNVCSIWLTWLTAILARWHARPAARPEPSGLNAGEPVRSQRTGAGGPWRHMKDIWKTYEKHKDVQSRKTTWIRDATLVKDFIPLQSGTGAFGHCSVMLLSRDAYRKCLVKPAAGRFFLTFVVMLKLVEMVSPQPSACPQHVSKVSRCSRCLRNMSLMPPGFETGSPWHRPHECYIMLHNYHTIIILLDLVTRSRLSQRISKDLRGFIKALNQNASKVLNMRGWRRCNSKPHLSARLGKPVLSEPSSSDMNHSGWAI